MPLKGTYPVAEPAFPLSVSLEPDLFPHTSQGAHELGHTVQSRLLVTALWARDGYLVPNWATKGLSPGNFDMGTSKDHFCMWLTY